MKTPGFWQSSNWASTLLLPLAALYDISATLARAWVKPETLSVPVICVGNLTTGGAGKTPVAIAIGERLKEKNIKPFFLSRGYGGSARGPLLVDPNKHLSREVGDEALLLARHAPTVVSKNRLLGAKLAIAQGAEAIVMDDGFQNPSVAKTLSFIVIDGTSGFGNERILPAGPLREPIASGIRRAQAVIVVNRTNMIHHLPHDKPVLFAKVSPRPEAHALKGKKLLAFCGLAYPQKFYSTLASLGAHVVDSASFPDHYPYKDGDVKKLTIRAHRHGALLVTTAKDAVRLSPAMRKLVTVVEVSLAFDRPEQIDALLAAAMKTP